jgi:predicted DNA-binding ArsR family transcriptional regulator
MATHADDDAKRSTASAATSTITVARAIEEKYGRGGEGKRAARYLKPARP